MNSNKFELEGLILHIQDTTLNNQNYKLVNLQVIKNDMANSIPVYIKEEVLKNIAAHSNVIIHGYLSIKIINPEQPQVILNGTNVDACIPNIHLQMPDAFLDGPPLDESYFCEQSNTEAKAYTLPIEAFTKADEKEEDQGIFITSDNLALDLNSNESFEQAMSLAHCHIDYENLWSLSSKELMIEVLKRNHSEDQKKVMIGIALSKEITDKKILSHTDLVRFFSKFSDLIKIGTRKFNGQLIPFIRVRMAHYAGGQYIFRFISPIFSETPTSPLDWSDFTGCFNHLNPRNAELLLKSKQLEELFTRSESIENYTTNKSPEQNKNQAIQRAAMIRLNGM